jgi:hypothetical protein
MDTGKKKHKNKARLRSGKCLNGFPSEVRGKFYCCESAPQPAIAGRHSTSVLSASSIPLAFHPAALDTNHKESSARNPARRAFSISTRPLRNEPASRNGPGRNFARSLRPPRTFPQPDSTGPRQSFRALRDLCVASVARAKKRVIPSGYYPLLIANKVLVEVLPQGGYPCPVPQAPSGFRRERILS